MNTLSPTSYLASLEHGHGDLTESTPSRPLSGPGASRQARRLQLRNAGFRGAALPARKVTPKSISSSTWSTASGMPDSSDVENVSPSGRQRSATTEDRRVSSGILQEIGNSTVIRPKKARPRLSSSKLFQTDTPVNGMDYSGGLSSPPPPKTTIQPRSVKSRAKMSHKRRSVSAEMSKYIEHLESELAATQSRLSSITSPSVTRVQSSKMRNLNAETRQLQEEIADWEAKYEQRVQEEVDRHSVIEADLRARIRSLEQDAEETKFKVQELESQIESTAQNMEAVEAANVNLEKRLEIMSELLAASPTKIDLHAQTPGRGRRHVRPKSMLPRFPTASSLMGSPERQPRTQPTSPLLAFSSHSPRVIDSPTNNPLPLDLSSEQSDLMSEAESVFSEASAPGDSMTSAENFDAQPSFNPWSQNVLQNTKTKPARRMRRFGAGSLGPKPLILPSTSHCDNFPPASAPPLERSETTPAFFPGLSRTSEDSRTPLVGRRRASTIANELSFVDLEPSPFFNLREPEFAEDTMMSLSGPNSSNSHTTTQRFSSLGSGCGRNLMDELTAVRSNNSTESPGPTPSLEQPHEHSVYTHTARVSRNVNECDNISPAPGEHFGLPRDATSNLSSTSSLTSGPNHHRARSRSVSIPAIGQSASAFDRLRMLFGDLWRSPVALARHLIQTAQARMRIPQPLRNVQWWLVGVLLGPMARLRMLSNAGSCEDLEHQSLLRQDTRREDGVNDAMAYGTFYETPPASPTRRTTGATGRGKRRALSKMRCTHHRAKHSPLLWLKFSITLAFAIGTAFKDGPGSLLKATVCSCRRREADHRGRVNERSLSTPC